MSELFIKLDCPKCGGSKVDDENKLYMDWADCDLCDGGGSLDDAITHLYERVQSIEKAQDIPDE